MCISLSKIRVALDQVPKNVRTWRRWRWEGRGFQGRPLSRTGVSRRDVQRLNQCEARPAWDDQEFSLPILRKVGSFRQKSDRKDGGSLRGEEEHEKDGQVRCEARMVIADAEEDLAVMSGLSVWLLSERAMTAWHPYSTVEPGVA